MVVLRDVQTSETKQVYMLGFRLYTKKSRVYVSERHCCETVSC